MTIYLITRSDCDSDHATNDGMVLYSGFAVVRAYHTLEEAKTNLLEAVMESIDPDFGEPEDWEAKPGMLDDNYNIVESIDYKISIVFGAMVLFYCGDAYAAFEIRTIEI